MKPLSKILKSDNVSRIPQQHEGEDGLACIAMLFSHAGVDISIEDLRNDYPHFLSGISMREIIEIFSARNFVSKAFHCPIYELVKLKLPCILHWDMQQFVVLSSIKNDVYTVLNPADAKIRYSRQEFEQHYNEIALQITSEEQVLI
jgi:ATP-binding cassette, subfamily B, bacterial CvaB/MchF/RaxB